MACTGATPVAPVALMWIRRPARVISSPSPSVCATRSDVFPVSVATRLPATRCMNRPARPSINMGLPHATSGHVVSSTVRERDELFCESLQVRHHLRLFPQGANLVKAKLLSPLEQLL